MGPSAIQGSLPEFVRVSVGSAVMLGLMDAKIDAPPTTTYLMTHKKGKCDANCSFCPQARESQARADLLSRVTWPSFKTTCVLDRIKKTFHERKTKRVCLQALNYPSVFDHLAMLAHSISSVSDVPISVSCQPVERSNIIRLADSGVERIAIPLDAATEDIFKRVKGASGRGIYDWKKQLELLKGAIEVFGKWRVSTHLIVGLGETEEQMASIIQECVDMTVLPGLFAFTPIPGTALADRPQPSLDGYRRIQVARYVILQKIARYENMRFDDEGALLDFGVDRQTLTTVIEHGRPFLTSGCPNCNRPYYNEKPSGPVYNYPRDLTMTEISSVGKELNIFK